MSTSEYSESPEQPRVAVDEEAVQRAKREIQVILKQIADLSKQDVAPERFYDEFLNRVVTALAASGGAVWTLSGSGVLQLTYQINLRDTGLIENPIGQEQHGRLLTQVLQETEGRLVAPHSGAGGGSDSDDDHGAANPTDFLLVMAPVYNDQGVQGVVEIFQRPGARDATKRGYLRFLLQTCDLAGDYLRGRRLAHLTEKQTLWEQLESFTRSAHETLDVTAAAYTIANEGRRLIGCDRVTVAVKHGSRVKIEAISGQDTFDRRSNVSTLLTKVAKAVTRTGEDVWYSGDASQLAPQVERAIEAYVDESQTKNMAILPLVEAEDEEATPEEKKKRRGPPKVFGALIVEQMVDGATPEGYRQRVDVVRGHSITALGNALEHNSLFLMPVWKTLGKATSLFRGRTLPKTLAVIALVAGAIAGGVLYQKDFKLEAKGHLRPIVSQPVWAQASGHVDDLLVQYNSPVTSGQPVLTMTSSELESAFQDIVGKLQQAQEKQLSLSTTGFDPRRDDPNEYRKEAAELVQVEQEIDSLNKQLEIIENKKKLLVLRSPIDGRVVEWDLKQQFPRGRPIQQGSRVMEIADPSGGWKVELLMPEKSMGHVTRQWNEAKQNGGTLLVEFIPATHPDQTIQGQVVEIDTTSESRGEEGNTVKLRVDFDQEKFLGVVDDPKIDAMVTANVYCGKRSFFYCYLHDAWDTLQSKVFFRL